MELKAQLTLSHDDLENLLCSAWEGGSTYWVGEARITKEPTIKCEYTWQIPLFGGELEVIDDEGDYKGVLNAETLLRGWKYICSNKETEDGKKYVLRDIVGDNIDAGTGDGFMQACLFGQIIFG